jgi:maltooligosyltrehalose trehalohydrolase
MTEPTRPPRLGAFPGDRGTEFRVWAPAATEVALALDDGREISLATDDGTYYHGFIEDVYGGARYRYRLDGGDPLPDPASRYQPDGVHGPSMAVDPSFAWSDREWLPPERNELVFYELHVGTFAGEGTFSAAAARLPYLAELGVTAVELMPVADFPGRWNWGYDQSAMYAPSRAYGTPEDLRQFVDTAHRLGLAVFLDVIYNHLGPDGAYLPAYGPIFTERHTTPWGPAVNLDDDGSRGVRDLFIDNALHWLEEYHFDGLRLDATHALIDDSPTHFLAELSQQVGRLSPKRYLVAEDHRNLNTLLLPTPGGFGMDAVWADDFHHQIRNITAGDTEGYYTDFAETTTSDLAETITRGWFYDGRQSKYTGRHRGSSAEPITPNSCVVCIQNHDQIGNRPTGDRLTDSVSQEVYRAASAILLFGPELPLLFMGQEWAASTPFLFFTDHGDEIGPLVSKGRKQEFRDFPGFNGDVPDPQDPETFARSKLDWLESDRDEHARTRKLYRDLLTLRRELPDETDALLATPHGRAALHVRRGRYHLLATFTEANLDLPEGAEIILHTEQMEYTGDPVPPAFEAGRVRFGWAGAVVVRVGEGA